MRETEFDKFADEYRDTHAKNISASGEAPEFFAEYKVKDLAVRLAGTLLEEMRILDFGSGVGTSVPWFRKYFPASKITCLDVSRKSLAFGKERYSEQARFVHFDGESLPFDAATFEVAFAACVFHHIDHEEHTRLLKELYRILVPGGRIIVFEHNPYNPLTVRAVNTCPFDVNAVLVQPRDLVRRVKKAGFDEVGRRYRIFFPHVVRVLRPLESYVAWLPLGAQYYVMGTKHAID